MCTPRHYTMPSAVTTIGSHLLYECRGTDNPHSFTSLLLNHFKAEGKPCEPQKCKRPRKAGVRLGMWRPRRLATATVSFRPTRSQQEGEKLVRRHANVPVVIRRRGTTHVENVEAAGGSSAYVLVLCSTSLSCEVIAKRWAREVVSAVRGVKGRLSSAPPIEAHLTV